MILWAITSGCTAATQSTPGILLVRFFLGFVEAPFFPGAVYYLSCWYTKREIGVRMALLVCGILLSNAFAGLISAGILSGMGGVAGLAAWRWLFILEGLATVVLGCLALVVLPDFPSTTKWLTDSEKVVAQARLAVDSGTSTVNDEEVPIMRGIAWAVKDARTWIFACLQMSTTASISYSHFFPTLIKQLGFENNTIVHLRHISWHSGGPCLGHGLQTGSRSVPSLLEYLKHWQWLAPFSSLQSRASFGPATRLLSWFAVVHLVCTRRHTHGSPLLLHSRQSSVLSQLDLPIHALILLLFSPTTFGWTSTSLHIGSLGAVC